MKGMKRLQFGLRSLLILLTIAAIIGGVFVARRRAEQREQRLRYLYHTALEEAARGKKLSYRPTFEEWKKTRQPPPPKPGEFK
jgi:hypothetical protein